MIFQKIAE